ncbi:MAG: tRNA pseudouridine(55) synthase TruB [Candidatus Omnitrophota bacterium]|nr:tRNA pseudouridine(55) synthase TruB [Candidatus Omnitrophota bacterium]
MAFKDREDPFVGILVVNKEKGMTSHDVVQLVRRRFVIKKVGHAGTLDPNATGVLVLLLGKATKLSGRFLNEDKEYMATMKLGDRTDSGDSDGKMVISREISSSEDEIKEAVSGFVGEISQVPPMVSAKRVNGKRLYKLARKGVEVKREPNKIVISGIEITNIDMPFVRFRVVCSKGTYVRQLADDIGEKLGCGAHLTDLQRIRSGSFTLKEAVSYSSLLDMDRKKLNENILRL